MYPRMANDSNHFFVEGLTEETLSKEESKFVGKTNTKVKIDRRIFKNFVSDLLKSPQI